MEFILDLFPLIKIFLVFIIVIFLQQKWLPIGLAFMGGVLLLELWFPLPLKGFLLTVLHSLTSGTTITLSLIMVLIVSLSHSLKITGHFDKIVSSIRAFIASNRTSVFILPALIGLLPMPGGAIFSAPMVEEISDTSLLSRSEKTAANYWFRHVWEYTWPLYPGIILTASIVGVSILTIIVIHIPLTIAAIAGGFLFIARKHHFEGTEGKTDDSVTIKQVFVDIFPIIIIIVCFVIGRLFCAGIIKGIEYSASNLISTLPGAYLVKHPVPPYLENTILIVSIMAGILFQLFEYPKLRIRDVFKNKRIPALVLMIISLLLFQDMLKSCGAVQQIITTFHKWNFPLLLSVSILPMTVGLLTGLTVGFVSGSFPIIVPLILVSGNGEHMLAYIVIAFACGFMGVMLSPLHICLVLTTKHFSASLGKTLKLIIIPAILVIATAVIVSAVLFHIL